MTLPFERKRAVTNTEQFLKDLLDPQKTPRVPANVRRQAGGLLKHYPRKHEMESAGEQAANIFGDDDLKVLTKNNKPV
jgi:hypothetical protein